MAIPFANGVNKLMLPRLTECAYRASLGHGNCKHVLQLRANSFLSAWFYNDCFLKLVLTCPDYGSIQFIRFKSHWTVNHWAYKISLYWGSDFLMLIRWKPCLPDKLSSLINPSGSCRRLLPLTLFDFVPTTTPWISCLVPITPTYQQILSLCIPDGSRNM